MKTARQKSDLVKLFELASGWELPDYLKSRASNGWSWKDITEEMNGMIRDFLTRDSAKAIRAELFRIMPCNLSRWYTMFGIKSKVKRGVKKGFKYKKGESHVN